MMYEEMVKRLKNTASLYFALPTDCNDLSLTRLLSKAADAIEELSKLVDAIPHICECCIGCEAESGGCDQGFVLSPKRAKEYLSKFRWIPVTERLPEPRTEVIATFDDGEVLHVWQQWSVSKDQEPLAYSKGANVTHRVTYWMPFPDPPKEE